MPIIKVKTNQNWKGQTSTTGASTTSQSTDQTGQQAAAQILDKRALQDLVKEVDPSEQLDEDVEEVFYSIFNIQMNFFYKIDFFFSNEQMLLQVADDFIENIINTSCQLAKHRKSNVLEVKDVQFHLGMCIKVLILAMQWFLIMCFNWTERNFNIWIPGFSSTELKQFKKSYATEAHKQVTFLVVVSSDNVRNLGRKLKFNWMRRLWC